MSAAAIADGPAPIRLHNLVMPALFGVGLIAVVGTGFLAIAPNRLVSGQPVTLFAAGDVRLSLAIAVSGVILLLTAMAPPTVWLHRASAIIAGILLLLILVAAGQGATALTAGAPKLARVSLGTGFWLLLGAAALAIVDGLQRVAAGAAERLVFVVVIAATVAALAFAGLFDMLSLAREYHIREPLFATALLRHVVLVAAAVIPAVLIGFPLGVAAVRRPNWQGSLFAILNLLQTVPSIALFGLLLAPLSALATAVPLIGVLGIGGVGPAPAIIALVLYALLPVVRNTVAGIGGVDAGVLDAARGMGLTRRQRFWQVELPLAAPLLLAGLRIVIVQAIGLAVIAALIGAGGLGTFVFEGLGQYAADLVLLGALPAILLALTVNFAMQLLVAAVAR